MLKIKHDRTADVVVAGYRLHKNSTEERPLLGSLLLALYDDAGALRHIGVSASFTEKRRGELFDELQPLVCGPEDHPWGAWSEVTASGGKAAQANVSRWNAGKDLSFQLLRPERVVEVGYDHMEGERFRHTAQFKRWRDDREPVVLHLRAARGAGLLRPRRGPRRLTLGVGREHHEPRLRSVAAASARWSSSERPWSSSVRQEVVSGANERRQTSRESDLSGPLSGSNCRSRDLHSNVWTPSLLDPIPGPTAPADGPLVGRLVGRSSVADRGRGVGSGAGGGAGL